MVDRVPVGPFLEAVRRVRNLRCKGTVAKLDLVLRDLPAFSALDADLSAARLLIAPSATYVERAFNPVKYGALPTAPTIEAVFPSAIDSAARTGGNHLMSALVSFVPHTPKTGWTETNRAALVKTVLATLEEYAPGIENLVEAVDPIQRHNLVFIGEHNVDIRVDSGIEGFVVALDAEGI